MKGYLWYREKDPHTVGLANKKVALINVSVLRPSSGQTIQNTENHQTFVDYTHIVWASPQCYTGNQPIRRHSHHHHTYHIAVKHILFWDFSLNRALNNRERPVKGHPTRSSISKGTEKEDISGPSSLKTLDKNTVRI